MTAEDLIEFETEVAAHFEAGRIRAPVHLSGGNEAKLIGIFKNIGRADWVFCSYRSHYHALLHGVPRKTVMEAILAGHSMGLMWRKYRFFSSAIVAGHVPIAVGVAAGIKRLGGKERVWCFVGDMAAETGIFPEAMKYSIGHDLPVTFIEEDNGTSAGSPTRKCWGECAFPALYERYRYNLPWPHCNTGKWVNF